ncbi:MAG: hypothetical protein H5T44_02195 [Thermoplasmatales archaeon]|nr:hypothetical protein [Thermoplasmatales archaeon]
MNSNKLRKITREFNKHRAPECFARTLRNGRNNLVIVFSGTSSFSCCFDEHFEDYRQLLKEENENYEIEKVIRIGNAFVVTYKKLPDTACNSF